MILQIKAFQESLQIQKLIFYGSADHGGSPLESNLAAGFGRLSRVNRSGWAKIGYAEWRPVTTVMVTACRQD